MEVAVLVKSGIGRDDLRDIRGRCLSAGSFSRGQHSFL